jgi:prolyl-tRNA editing enzyme YbaK/EbsC (Cys-tRNA(Pro) deacylase)
MTQKQLNSSDLQNFIDTHNIPAEIVYLNTPTPTVEAAAEALGVSPDNIVKSILFLVVDEPVLALASGKSRIEYKALATYFNVNRKKIKLTKPNQTLAITGFEVGAMPPFGHLQPIRTLIDELVMKNIEVYAGGGELNALLRISPPVIQQITQADVANLHAPQA